LKQLAIQKASTARGLSEILSEISAEFLHLSKALQVNYPDPSHDGPVRPI
jgi:hypothetical protein